MGENDTIRTDETESESETGGNGGRDVPNGDESLSKGVEPLSIADGVRGRFELAVIVGSIPFWLVVFWYSYDQMRFVFSYEQMMPRGQFGTIFLGGVLLLYLLLEFPDALESDDRLELVLLSFSAVTIAITTLYLSVYFTEVTIDRAGHAHFSELVLALAFSLVMIYLTWRSFGATFLVVVLAGIGYGLAGPYVPGTLGHGGLSIRRTLRILVVSGDGFYGSLTQLVATWIALFLLYAGLLKAYGAFELILRMAVRSATYIDSGIAQTAVIASAVIGSVNGSQTANAGMTGSFTIPLMKRSGIRPETAGGIESVASTAGQVLPPVMGAGAFIMAEQINGRTYPDIIIAGLVPAFILVASIFIAVHYAAAPQIDDPSMGGMFDERLDRQEIVLESIKYGVPLFVLIYLLGVLQWTVMTTAFWTAITMIVFGTLIPAVNALLDWIQADYDGVTEHAIALVIELAVTIRTTIKQTIEGFRQGVVVVAPITIILAAINGVVDILMATGVPTAISLTLMDLSGGVMLVAVVLAMVICILLGLGMPTTASYTVVALLIAPTLIEQFFVPDIAAHYFVFYAAILAGLTPPIATCVAVTTGIAGSDFWRTCLEAIKISAPLFVLPFAFVYHPELVSGEFTGGTLLAGLVAMLASIAIIHGANYRFAFTRERTYLLRGIFIASGIVAMVHWEQLIQFAALGVAAALYTVQVSLGKPDPVSVMSRASKRRGQR